MTESYWLTEPFEPFPAPRGGGRVDVAVVGAGVTGCACALALAEGGLRVRVQRGAAGRLGCKRPKRRLRSPRRRAAV